MSKLVHGKVTIVAFGKLEGRSTRLPEDNTLTHPGGDDLKLVVHAEANAPGCLAFGLVREKSIE